MPNLTYKFIIHLNMIERSGITMMQILNLLDVQLISLIGKRDFWTKNEKVTFFNETILNILRDFKLHEAVFCGDRDRPWFNNKIKSFIHIKKHNT